MHEFKPGMLGFLWVSGITGSKSKELTQGGCGTCHF